MKEQNIINEACPGKVECTPEKTIRYLRQELKDQSIKKEELWDKLSTKDCQVHALVDILCDLRDMNKTQANDLNWQRRRTADYRDIHYEVGRECEEVIYSYEMDEHGDIDESLYEFAKKINDILRRI